MASRKSGSDGVGSSREKDHLKQYSYKATSNLVLQQERPRRRDDRGETGGNEEIRGIGIGSGDVKPIRVGELSGARMGDRAQAARENPVVKPTRARTNQGPTKPSNKSKASDVLQAASALDSNLENDEYVPQSKVAQVAYEQLLSFVYAKLGEHPRDIIQAAAQECLTIVKSEVMRDDEKRRELGFMFGISKVSESDLSAVSIFARQIHDIEFQTRTEQDGRQDDDLDDQPAKKLVEEEENVGVSIILEDEDEQEASRHGFHDGEYTDVVQDDDDEEEEEGEGEGEEETGANVGEDTTERRNERGSEHQRLDIPKVKDQDIPEILPADQDHISPQAIDAYWIPRQLDAQSFGAEETQRLTNEIFELLSSDKRIRVVENKLVELLGFDKLDLVKLFVKNRFIIVHMTSLSRLDSLEDRQEYENELSKLPEGMRLLQELKGQNVGPLSKKRDFRDIADEMLPLSKKARTQGAPAQTIPTVDLATLSFSQGSHFSSSRAVELPKGSFRIAKKDYEEVHVPAVLPDRQGVAAKSLISVESLPEFARQAFRSTANLNRVQSRVFPKAFESDSNMLLCAPTGAGKTNVAMLCILRVIHSARNATTNTIDLGRVRVVYIAPMKALVSELVGNLGSRLQYLNIQVKELSGDISLTRQEMDQTHVIITTPEKWDIVTRKTTEGIRSLASSVKLVIIDEIHLLHDDRGPVLEAVIARMSRAVNSGLMETRLVGLSATLPNYKDVAALLHCDPLHDVFYFDSTYRPCPLQTKYVGVSLKNGLKRLQLMNQLAYQEVKAQVLGLQGQAKGTPSEGPAGSSQVIVFVHSRKETSGFGNIVKDMAFEDGCLDSFMIPDSVSHDIIRSEIETVKNADLKQLLPHGIGIHHAGLARSDRSLVEELFEGGHLKVLVSTATLAWGVNLPAHAVVIKGTQVYSPEKGAWTELSPMDVMQMMGRAGRPQFDTFGEGIIITTQAELQFYLSLLNQQLPIESQLIGRLPDMLNAEVALSNVTNRKQALEWLSYTYLYVRMARNPGIYGVPQDDQDYTDALTGKKDDESEDSIMRKNRIFSDWTEILVHSTASVLDKVGLIRYNRSNGTLVSTDLGRIASQYYLTYHSMAIYLEHLKPNIGMIDLLRSFCLSGEFAHLRVREEEKLEIQRLAERVPIPIRDAIDQPVAKANVLLQSYISRLKLEGLALSSDMVYITQSAGRILRGLFDIVLRRGWAPVAERCLNLCKMVYWQQWPVESPLRQFSSYLPSDAIKKLERKDIDIEALYDLSAEKLGAMFQNPKLGVLMYRLLHHIPLLEVAAHVQPIHASMLSVSLTIMPDFAFDKKIHGAGESFWVWVEDADSENILFVQPLYIRSAFAEDEHSLCFTVPIREPMPPNYFVRVLSDRWFTPERYVPISFANMIIPESQNAPFTKLLGLHPLFVSQAFRSDSLQKEALEDESGYKTSFLEACIAYFSSQFKILNPIQTQVFPSLFGIAPSKEKENGREMSNCLVACPSSSGRSVLIELAIAQAMYDNPRSVCVLIDGYGEGALQYYHGRLTKGLADAFGLKCSILTGDASADLKTLDVPGSLVLATPENWDVLSRRWKQRKAVRKVSLFIANNIHLVGAYGLGEKRKRSGAVFEVIVSRVRYMNAYLSNNKMPVCRLIAFSDPISNARDIADWMDVSPQHRYSFAPSSRPVSLETHIQTISLTATPLAVGMARPVLNAIRSYAQEENQRVLVLVSSRTTCRALALEILALSAALPIRSMTPGMNVDHAANVESAIHSRALQECVKHGIAFLHEGMKATEIEIIRKWFDSGMISVVITVPSFVVRNRDFRSTVVILAGTETDDQKFTKHSQQYPLCDISLMLGLAGRPGKDSKGVAVLITDPAFKDFYVKSLLDPFPVESFMEQFLSDHVNAEIVSKVIESRQDAVDYLTWTLYYRRLVQNPSFFGLLGTSHHHLSEHLSELIDSTLTDLRACKCITIEATHAEQGEAPEGSAWDVRDDVVLGPLNLGLVAAYYYIDYFSLELFSSSIAERTRARGLVEILASAKEFSWIPIRQEEEALLLKLASAGRIRAKDNQSMKNVLSDPHAKALALMESHFSRTSLQGELDEQRSHIVKEAIRFTFALVDVIGSSGWLRPALAAMELSQMLVQACWDRESPLKQLPHFTSEIEKRLKELQVDGIFDVIDLEDEDRLNAFQMDTKQLSDVAAFCNAYPNIEFGFDVEQRAVEEGETVRVSIKLKRDTDEEDADEDVEERKQIEKPLSRSKKSTAPVPTAYAPYLPFPKQEGWWVCIGDVARNMLLSVKRVQIPESTLVELEFVCPSVDIWVGANSAQSSVSVALKVFLMCDSYLGCDQEDEFELTITRAND